MREGLRADITSGHGNFVDHNWIMKSVLGDYQST